MDQNHFETVWDGFTRVNDHSQMAEMGTNACPLETRSKIKDCVKTETSPFFVAPQRRPPIPCSGRCK